MRAAHMPMRAPPASAKQVSEGRTWNGCFASGQAEFEVLFRETGAIKSLDSLDALLARQPELADGSRVCAVHDSHFPS